MNPNAHATDFIISRTDYDYVIPTWVFFAIIGLDVLTVFLVIRWLPPMKMRTSIGLLVLGVMLSGIPIVAWLVDNFIPSSYGIWFSLTGIIAFAGILLLGGTVTGVGIYSLFRTFSSKRSNSN